jgi:hypothetical protein
MRGSDMTLAEIRRDCESHSGLVGIRILAVRLLPGRQALAPGFHILQYRLVTLGRG